MDSSSVSDAVENRGRRSRRRRQRSTADARDGAREVASEIQAWLKLIDGVLVGVEKTAWSVRELAEEVRGVWTVNEGDLRSVGTELGGNGRGLLRLTRTGFALGQIAAS